MRLVTLAAWPFWYDVETGNLVGLRPAGRSVGAATEPDRHLRIPGPHAAGSAAAHAPARRVDPLAAAGMAHSGGPAWRSVHLGLCLRQRMAGRVGRRCSRRPGGEHASPEQPGTDALPGAVVALVGVPLAAILAWRGRLGLGQPRGELSLRAPVLPADARARAAFIPIREDRRQAAATWTDVQGDSVARLHHANRQLEWEHPRRDARLNSPGRGPADPSLPSAGGTPDGHVAQPRPAGGGHHHGRSELASHRSQGVPRCRRSAGVGRESVRCGPFRARAALPLSLQPLVRRSLRPSRRAADRCRPGGMVAHPHRGQCAGTRPARARTWSCRRFRLSR